LRKDAILSMPHDRLAKCLNVFCWLQLAKTFSCRTVLKGYTYMSLTCGWSQNVRIGPSLLSS
jgi:hypothetical protein